MRKLSRRSPYFLRKFHFPRGKGNMTGLEQKKRLQRKPLLSITLLTLNH